MTRNGKMEQGNTAVFTTNYPKDDSGLRPIHAMATPKKVIGVASRLGYEPDPEVSNLMA